MAGENTTLRPSAAPDWLRPALGAAESDMNELLRGRGPRAGAKKAAAVLIAMAGDSLDEAEVLLTHRSPSMRSHSGQIAFPGGRIDPTDTGPVDAALREATEETGLDRAAVTPLAMFEELYIAVTGNPVYPVLAHWHTPAEVGVASPDENDDVFLAPLPDLIAPTNRLMVGYGGWAGPAFWHRGYLIWGFTGVVLSSLIDYAGWEEPWDRDTVADLTEIVGRSRNNEVIR